MAYWRTITQSSFLGSLSRCMLQSNVESRAFNFIFNILTSRRHFCVIPIEIRRVIQLFFNLIFLLSNDLIFDSSAGVCRKIFSLGFFHFAHAERNYWNHLCRKRHNLQRSHVIVPKSPWSSCTVSCRR